MVKFYFYLNRLNKHINHCYSVNTFCASPSPFSIPMGDSTLLLFSVVKATEATL